MDDEKIDVSENSKIQISWENITATMFICLQLSIKIIELWIKYKDGKTPKIKYNHSNREPNSSLDCISHLYVN